MIGDVKKPSSRRDPADCSHCATRSHCLLGAVSDEELQLLQVAIHRRAFRRGDVLAREGEVARSVRIVKVGSAFGYRGGLDGRARPIGIGGRGAVFGILGLYDQPTQATVLGASAGRFCEVSHDALRKLAAKRAEFGARLVRAAVESCGRVAAWSEGMRVRGTTNQLAYALLLLADAQHANVIELPTHTALAHLLGTTRETIARSLAALAAERCIRRGERKKCEIHRQALLARLDGRTD